MCSRPSVPLVSSTNAPKVGRLDDVAGEVVADLDLLRHRRMRPMTPSRGLLVGSVDEDRAVVLDVDLDVELVGQAADRLAALADEEADLVGVDLDG